MKMTDMRAKARAIFGPAIAEPMPKQPNGAKALQERANARPIPTYKVGGAVKKNTPPQPTAAEREADRKRREEYAKMKVSKEQGEAITRGNRAAAIEGGRYKKGGKVQTSADTAKKLATEMGGMKKGGKAKKDGLAVMIAIGEPMKGMKKPVKKAVGGAAKGNFGASDALKQKMAMGAAANRGKPASNFGASDSLKEKLMMEAMTNKGKPSTNLGGSDSLKQKMAMQAAANMGKPVKRAKGGMACAKDGGEMMKPVKRAAGGAAKVRKGMMTPEGKITHAMNKVRGK